MKTINHKSKGNQYQSSTHSVSVKVSLELICMILYFIWTEQLFPFVAAITCLLFCHFYKSVSTIKSAEVEKYKNNQNKHQISMVCKAVAIIRYYLVL